ncbi:MAG: efflux RND transporter periplasmic adaptor subunit [Gammaproteobacteria bacterium]
MRFLLRHPIAILFSIAVLGLGYAVVSKVQQNNNVVAGARGAGGGATAVRVTTVSREVFVDRVESVGTAGANESVNLTPKISDTISRITFEEGGMVEKGEILVELTSSSEATRLAEAQSTADEAQRQYERLQSLLADNLISGTDLDAARTRAETAQARLEGVAVAMDNYLIRAPFSGMLGFRNVSDGSLVTPNTVITTLDDISIIKLDFTIAEVYLAQLKIGQLLSAQSIVYPDHAFEGVVQVIGSRIDPVTRSVQVRAHIDNRSGVLRPGMLLTVSLALNESDSVVVDESVLVPSGGRQYAFVVDDEDVVRQVEVLIGRRQPGKVEVLGGLQVGDRVVTEGMAQLRPGMNVRVLNNPTQHTSSQGNDASVNSDTTTAQS